MILALALVAVSAFMQSTSSSDQSPGAGISLTLAQERARRVSDLRYELHFSIPSEVTSAVTGRARITFALTDAARPLALDFTAPGRVTSASAKGLTHVPDHLVIPPADLRQGRNEITIEFIAGDAALNRNPEFLYSLFVPARAHLAFPCFDQPDLKARWTLSLAIPAEWQAVANGATLDESRRDGRLHVSFKETEPLSTYLFAFAAGRFAMETGERGGRTFRMFHRETDAAKVAQNRDAIFDLHAAALAWLERYTAIPYPWGKFDFLLVPSFQFGGMEHPGAVFYNASGLLLDPSATQNQKLGRASLIAHETAHMWFGDLVTMKWFNDVWMKEVFANFMAAKIVNPSFPEINHDLRFLLAHYPAAYDIDRTPAPTPSVSPARQSQRSGIACGAIIYQKAPIVSRQLEGLIGEEPFQRAASVSARASARERIVGRSHRALLDARTAEDLATWSRAGSRSGASARRAPTRVEHGRIASLAFAQRDPVAARGLLWNQPLDVTIGLPEGPRTLRVRLADGRADVPAARGLPAPLFVLPSGGGIGYGGFELDAASLAYLTAHLDEIRDPLTRGAAWVTLWDQMLDGRTTAGAIVDLALRALPGETDEQRRDPTTRRPVEVPADRRPGSRRASNPALRAGYGGVTSLRWRGSPRFATAIDRHGRMARADLAGRTPSPV